MNKFNRLLVSLRILQLEIELASLKDALQKSTSGTHPPDEESIKKRTDSEVDNRTITISILPDNSIHFLLKTYPWRKLRIRIDSRNNHKRPHLHIDIDGDLHSSSIAIDNGEELAGDLDRKIRKVIKKWIKDNREILTEIWNEVQMGKAPYDLRDQVSDVNE